MRSFIKQARNSVSRILFIIYLIFSQVIRSLVFNNSSLSAIIAYALLGIALLTQVIEENKKIKPSNTMLLYILFVFLEFITSILVAQDKQKAFTYLVVLIEYLGSFYLIQRFVEKDKGIEFVSAAFILLAFVMSVATISRGTEVYSRLSIAESTNSNSVGVVMMFGIAFALLRFIRADKSIKNIMLFLIFLLPCIYVLVLTVSKKAIIGTVILLIGWAIICYGKAFSRIHVFLRILILAMFIGLGFFAFRWFVGTQTSSYQYILFRFNSLNDLSVDRSSGERLALIKEGFLVFLNHPIIGVGYNNYRYYSNYGLYTHCFYIEMLACTGVLGTIVFASPIVSSFTHYIPTLKHTSERDEWGLYERRYLFYMYIVLLIIAWTQIIFYEFALMYMLAVFVSYIEMYRKHSAEIEPRGGLLYER